MNDLIDPTDPDDEFPDFDAPDPTTAPARRESASDVPPRSRSKRHWTPRAVASSNRARA